MLVFIGAKIFVAQFTGKIPPYISLGVTAGLIVAGILFSMLMTRKSRRTEPDESATQKP